MHPFRLTVAAVIERDGLFLMVEEQVDDRQVINQPAGHVEPGEALADAVRREVREETARDFDPAAIVGTYCWRPASGHPYLRVAFTGNCGDPVPGRVLDTGILGTSWWSREALAAAAERLRSPMVLRCIDDYLAGERAALPAPGLPDSIGLAARATRL
jgi:8-oxo-dGTP pyrophosphatase MutT (NUDIX family)